MSRITDISCEKSPNNNVTPANQKDIKDLILDTDTSIHKGGKINAKVMSSEELVEKLKKEIENSFEDFYENRINYDKLIANIQGEIRKIKHLLISNKAFKEKIFNKISKDDKVKYNLLNEILRKLINEQSKPDIKKMNIETLTKIRELSKPKLLDKLNTEMTKHNRVITSPVTAKKVLISQVTSTLSPVGRNLDKQLTEIQNSSTNVNKSFSIPKYLPLNERLPIMNSQTSTKI